MSSRLWPNSYYEWHPTIMVKSISTDTAKQRYENLDRKVNKSLRLIYCLFQLAFTAFSSSPPVMQFMRYFLPFGSSMHGTIQGNIPDIPFRWNMSDKIKHSRQSDIHFTDITSFLKVLARWNFLWKMIRFNNLPSNYLKYLNWGSSISCVLCV